MLSATSHHLIRIYLYLHFYQDYADSFHLWYSRRASPGVVSPSRSPQSRLSLSPHLSYYHGPLPGKKTS